MRKSLKFIISFTMAATISGTAMSDKLRMGAISPGSSSYLVMTTMATTVNLGQNEHQVYVDAAGASTRQMIDAARGDLDFVLAAPDTYNHMVAGNAMYSELQDSKELSENLGLVYWFPQGVMHVATYADSKIKTLRDLKGKRVFLGPYGSGAFAAASQWLDAVVGLKAGVDYKAVDASWNAGYQSFKAKQIDVYFSNGVAPFSQVAKLADQAPIRLLGISTSEAENPSDVLRSLISEIGYSFGEIPAGIYGGAVVNSETVFSIGSLAGVVARRDLSEDVVYKVTKAFWESLPSVRKEEPHMNTVTLDDAFAATNMKLHPGALRYYKDIGLQIPQEIM